MTLIEAGPMQTFDPTTEEPIVDVERASDARVGRALETAARAFASWRDVPFERRRLRMRAAAEVLRGRSETLAELMVREMGKPIDEARAEIDKCAWVCEHYADRAASYLSFEPIETDAHYSGVRCEPIGPILAVMPWNFPFWQVFRFAAPTLMAGNVALLTHAPNVPRCAEAIAEVFDDAGLPEGVFTNLVIDREQTAAAIEDDRVRGVTLTGSVQAGRAVAQVAAGALKPTVLELGGSDPFVVLADADLDRAVREAVRARTLNSGQSCIAAKRFVVEEPVLDEFVEAFGRALSSLHIGDPRDPETDIGPLAREDLLQTLGRQVQESLQAGATCRLGGERLERTGYFYPPTLLTAVDREMPVFAEETFGPVAAVVAASDADEALELANDTNYGLGASLWTERERGRELVPRLEAGHVAVNGIVKSDPRLPFGGVGDSGDGRELGRPGIRAFVNEKTVWVG